MIKGTVTLGSLFGYWHFIAEPSIPLEIVSLSMRRENPRKRIDPTCLKNRSMSRACLSDGVGGAFLLTKAFIPFVNDFVALVQLGYFTMEKG